MENVNSELGGLLSAADRMIRYCPRCSPPGGRPMGAMEQRPSGRQCFLRRTLKCLAPSASLSQLHSLPSRNAGGVPPIAPSAL
jgi:hypothetical protein